MTDFYRAIGLDPRTPPQVLVGQITTLMQQTPPGPNYDYLQQALAALGTPEAKAAYDAWLFGPTPRSTGDQFVEYLRRFIGLGEMSLSAGELAALEQAGVQSTGAQRLLAWRRAVLAVLLLPLTVYAVLFAVDRFGGDYEGLTFLGAAVSVLPALAMLVLLAAVVVAVVRWTELTWTNRLLLWSWLAATVIPLISYVFPMTWYFDLASVETRSTLSQEAMLAIMRPGWTFGVVSLVLPVAVSLLSGVLRGVRRVKGLLPASSLPGWFLIVVAPIYAASILAVYSVLASAVDSALVMLGVAAIVASPLVYVAYRKAYVAPMTHVEAARALQAPSIIATGLTLLGALLLTVYALTGEVLGRDLLGDAVAREAGEAWASYGSLPTLALGVFVRFSITSVVVAFIFVSIVRTDRHHAMTARPDVQAEFDRDVHSLAP